MSNLINFATFKSLKGSLFEEIISVPQEELKVSYNQLPTDDEIKIGKLSQFEMACIILYTKKIIEHDKMHEEMRRQNTDVRTREHILIHHQYKLLSEMVYGSIQSRIPEANVDYSLIKFRKPDVIVLIPNKTQSTIRLGPVVFGPGLRIGFYRKECDFIF